MRREDLINILNKEFDPSNAAEWDYTIGLQVEGKEDISKVVVTLDCSLDAITQAIASKADMIIAHHPLFFGKDDKTINISPILLSMKEILLKEQINLFVIHTNLDHAYNSISREHANYLSPLKVESYLDGMAVKALIPGLELQEIIDTFRNALNLQYSFNTNVSQTTVIENVVIASGTSGELVFQDDMIGNLLIVGEMKHHQWVEANSRGIKVLEIGHFSEIAFKDIISTFLEKTTEIEVIFAEEFPPYFSV